MPSTRCSMHRVGSRLVWHGAVRSGSPHRVQEAGGRRREPRRQRGLEALAELRCRLQALLDARRLQERRRRRQRHDQPRHLVRDAHGGRRRQVRGDRQSNGQARVERGGGRRIRAVGPRRRRVGATRGEDLGAQPGHDLDAARDSPGDVPADARDDVVARRDRHAVGAGRGVGGGLRVRADGIVIELDVGPRADRDRPRGAKVDLAAQARARVEDVARLAAGGVVSERRRDAQRLARTERAVVAGVDAVKLRGRVLRPVSDARSVGVFLREEVVAAEGEDAEAVAVSGRPGRAGLVVPVVEAHAGIEERQDEPGVRVPTRGQDAAAPGVEGRLTRPPASKTRKVASPWAWASGSFVSASRMPPMARP